MSTSGWNRNSKLLQLNGTSGQWTVHDVGSGQIPEGYGADFGICDDIVHVALNRWAQWGSRRCCTLRSQFWELVIRLEPRSKWATTR